MAAGLTDRSSSTVRGPIRPNADTASAGTGRNGSIVVVLLIAASAIVGLYFAFGMPGMTHNTVSMPGMVMDPAPGKHRLVDPATFEKALRDPGAVVINVHVPYEGEIEGTDLFLPFDSLDPTKLPTARTTELLVYCRTGRMSAKAATTLTELGYTNIVELDGGMQAWQASGRTVSARSVSTGP